MKQSNRVKAAMRAGRKAYGYNLSFPSPWGIDILGKLDFDFVFIDGEHGPFGLDQLEDLCRTAERHNVTTIARVPDIGSSTILRYLDRGIMGIVGSHIATEVDARQLVRACYFGPLGERSFGANRGTDYNAGIADKAAYYREANEQMLVCALLEDVAVLDNLDTILSVPGIDLYSIGPNDFAQSLGYPGQPDHPEVARTMGSIRISGVCAAAAQATLAEFRWQGRHTPEILMLPEFATSVNVGSRPRKARLSNSVSRRSVFARRCSRETGTLDGWMT
jgi:2-keto-3-deoxy-L-rhamnonate aldolase RhmA